VAALRYLDLGVEYSIEMIVDLSASTAHILLAEVLDLSLNRGTSLYEM